MNTQHVLGALFAFIFVLVSPRLSRADARMGIHIDELGHIEAIPGAPPSPEERSGTIIVAWCDGAADESRVHLGEWSLQRSRWLGAAIIRSNYFCPATLRLAWSQERLAFAVGAHGTTELILLERSERPQGIGSGFREVQKVTFENAEAPSLDTDGPHIALATYERVTPIDPPNLTNLEAPEPACHALHVRLLDATTLRIVSARVFRGAHLLRMHMMPHASGHAIRFLAGRLYVAVADWQPRIVAARIPSLTTERERVFVVPNNLREPNSQSVVLNRLGDNLLIGVGSTFVLSPKLENVAKYDRLPTAAPIAFDAASRRVLATDGDAMTVAGWNVSVVPTMEENRPTVLFAHGRAVILRGVSGTIRVSP